jgi:hypothetical protein
LRDGSFSYNEICTSAGKNKFIDIRGVRVGAAAAAAARERAGKSKRSGSKIDRD